MFKTSILKGENAQNMHPVIDLRDMINNKYTIQSHLGIPSGQADLYLCTYKAQQFIAKLYKHEVSLDESITERIRKIKSKRLVPIFECGTYKGRYYEVSPYYSKGDLSRVETIEKTVLRNYIIPFLNEALNEIHTHGLAHMDLKPSNIFIDSEDELYLGDFGICSVLSDASVKITTAKGTFGYRPPESYSEISIKSKHFDYYSFGMTLIHLWSGKSPYEGMSEMQILAYTLDGRILMPEDMPEDFQILIRGLTAYDKRKRIGYEEVKRWCNGFDIKNEVDLDLQNIKRFRVPGEYDLKGEVLTSMNDLSVVATRSEDHWEEAVMRLRNGLFDTFVSNFGDDALARLVESKGIKDDNYALSNLIFKTAGEQIAWKTMLYESKEELGKAMQLNFPQMLPCADQMVQSGFMEELVNESHSYNLFEIGYMLSNETLFYYKGEQVTSFETLSKTMIENGGDLLEDMDGLMKDVYFTAWLGRLKRRGGKNV